MPGSRAKAAIRFEVRGVPVPQGALKIGMMNGKDGKPHGHLFNRSSAPLAAWRNAIATEARRVAPRALWEGPVVIALTFRMPKPKSLKEWAGRGKARHRIEVWPAKRPDIDKMVRAALDALTGVVFGDDAQVVQLWAEKEYGVPGLKVTVGRVSRP